MDLTKSARTNSRTAAVFQTFLYYEVHLPDKCLFSITTPSLDAQFILLFLFLLQLDSARPSTNPPPCRAIIPISSCAANNPVSPLAAFATSAMANAPYATRTCGRQPWCASATSAPSETTRTNALYAGARASVMRSTASNARALRRTETAVPRSLTWAVQEPTYSTKRRVSGIISNLSPFPALRATCRQADAIHAVAYVSA